LLGNEYSAKKEKEEPMKWYFLTLSAAQVAAGTTLQYQDAFQKSFAAAAGPRTMALFQREREDGGAELFFTPECLQYAKELLEGWECSPCERPSLVGLNLLVGHNEITYYMP
jgi:hypothetical protein